MSYEIEKLLDNQDYLAPDPATGGFERPLVALFKDLQSNILTPHGFGCARYFFVRFNKDPAFRDDIRHFLATLAQNPFERLMFCAAAASMSAEGAPKQPLGKRLEALLKRRASRHKHVSQAKTTKVSGAKSGVPVVPERPSESAGETKVEADVLAKFRMASEHDVYQRRHAGGSSPAQYEVNVLLTRSGYTTLGEDPPPDAAFLQGMHERGPKLLNDTPETWEERYRQQADALFIVAFDEAPPQTQKVQEDDLASFKALLQDLVADRAADVWCESGRQLRVEDPKRQPRADGTRPSYPIEPFGFRDNISQPLFYAADRDRRAPLGDAAPRWNPFAPLRLALVPDPGGTLRYSCGSYFVLRKIEQHIDTFYEQSEALAKTRGRQAEDLREEFVGRKLDGTPLVAGNDLNDFDFSADAQGDQCPFHSHVRKSNPRGDVRGQYDTRQRRIVRRGIPYGPAIKRDKSGAPAKGRVDFAAAASPSESKAVGLLFLCAQRDIAGQFEAIQMGWQNQPNHPVGRWPGADTVSGHLPPGVRNSIGIKYENQDRRRYSKGNDAEYKPVVTVRGGDYFFAPSISFLRQLLEGFWT